MSEQCTTMECPNPGTVSGVYDDGFTRERATYCGECAAVLREEFTPDFATTSTNRDELRAAILGRLDTFASKVVWIGGSADLAFADSVLGMVDYLARKQNAEAAR